MSFADLNALYDAFADELANGTAADAEGEAEATDAEDAAATDAAEGATDEAAAPTYEPMLYSSKNPLEKVWTDLDTRPIWLAHYTDKTDYKGPYKVWQASCTGRIDGIGGDVDMDILYD